MAKGLNRQEIIGNLAADAELSRVGEKETPKLSFRVIANTGFGEYEHAEGFNVVIWGKRAEGLAAYMTKGQRVFVAGETRTHSWEGEDGQKHYRTEVMVATGGEIVLLGNGGSRGPAGESAPEPEVETGEDIPF
jgi:single-strand DNA-binding protein